MESHDQIALTSRMTYKVVNANETAKKLLVVINLFLMNLISTYHGQSD